MYAKVQIFILFKKMNYEVHGIGLFSSLYVKLTLQYSKCTSLQYLAQAYCC